MIAGKITFRVEADDGAVMTGEGWLDRVEVLSSYAYDFTGRPMLESTEAVMEVFQPKFTVVYPPRECWVTGEMV